MLQMTFKFNWFDCSPCACPYKAKAKRRHFGKRPLQLTLDLIETVYKALFNKSASWPSDNKKSLVKKAVNIIVNIYKKIKASFKKRWRLTLWH